MFKPKRQTPTMGNNLSRPWIISAFLVIFSLIPAPNALAETPTPEPSTPIVCGINCFNPGLYSIDQADSPWVVVNKIRPLNPITYRPVLDRTLNLAKPAADAYRSLKAAVSKAGKGTLCLNSGYRSYNTQVNTYNTDVKRYGKKVAENLAAHPGYSEHQTGLAADVSTTALGCRITNFGKSSAASWIAANGWRYGFIVRYPNGETATTGYQYEPWHIRFVGVELATKMHEAGITVLEKFWDLPAANTY